jgi:hypothetical protein
MTAETNKIRPAFMDAVEAAANLKTDRVTVLKYIEDGVLKAYGGKAGNPFVRTADVDKLAIELGVMVKPEEPAPDPKVVQRNDPSRKIKLRIQQDAKWGEVDEKAMRLWANEIDPITYVGMRKVANEAIVKLQQLLQVMDEVETENKAKQA